MRQNLQKRVLLTFFCTALFLFTLNSRATDLSSNSSNYLIENCGQIKSSNSNDADAVLYFIHSSDFSAFIKSNCISYQFFANSEDKTANTETHRIDMRLIGSNLNALNMPSNAANYSETFYTDNNALPIQSSAFGKVTLLNVYDKKILPCSFNMCIDNVGIIGICSLNRFGCANRWLWRGGEEIVGYIWPTKQYDCRQQHGHDDIPAVFHVFIPRSKFD